jgi:hypothetical protein
VSWEIVGNYKKREDFLKDKYKPKYDGEKRKSQNSSLDYPLLVSAEDIVNRGPINFED